MENELEQNSVNRIRRRTVAISLAVGPLIGAAMISLAAIAFSADPHRNVFIRELLRGALLWSVLIGSFMAASLFAIYAVAHFYVWVANRVSRQMFIPSGENSFEDNRVLDASDREHALFLVNLIQVRIEAGQSCEMELFFLEVLLGREGILLEQISKPRSPTEVLHELVQDDV